MSNERESIVKRPKKKPEPKRRRCYICGRIKPRNRMTLDRDGISFFCRAAKECDEVYYNKLPGLGDRFVPSWKRIGAS